MNNSYQFTLVLANVDDETPYLEDTLFEAGCDDALINYKNGTVYLDFDREAENLEEAVISAIQNVEAAGIGAQIVSVAPEHLVTLSDIAERVSLTKQSISLLASGERGRGGFPKPVLKISNKSPLWRWSSVAEWLYKQGKIKDQSMVENANFLEEVNIALDLRNRETLSHTQNILNAIERKRF